MDCLHCGKNIDHKRKGSKFCDVKCSNGHQAMLRAKKAEADGRYLVCDTCDKSLSRGNFSRIHKWDIDSPLRSTCKKCSAAKRERERRDRTWKDDAVSVLWNGSRQRAKRAGLEHTLTKADIVIPDKCPVFGCKLRRESREEWHFAPSLDRIDNTKGYIPGNVIVVCRRANILKNDATLNEMKALANFYSTIMKG